MCATILLRCNYTRFAILISFLYYNAKYAANDVPIDLAAVPHFPTSYVTTMFKKK